MAPVVLLTSTRAEFPQPAYYPLPNGCCGEAGGDEVEDRLKTSGATVDTVSTDSNTDKTEMHPELEAVVAEYRRCKAFDAAAWVEQKCFELNQWMAARSLSACVVSVSGGVDSAVVLGLCARAMRCADSPISRVIGVCQPIHSSNWALERGDETIAKFGTERVVVDQTEHHVELVATLKREMGVYGGEHAAGQLKSYLRTPVNYYVAQLANQMGSPAAVMGTSNKDDDDFLGYFCKCGDGMADLHCLVALHKSEVFKVARFLGVPDATLNAAPSSDLFVGQTHEDDWGFTTDFVELLSGGFLADEAAFVDGLSEQARAQFHDWKQQVFDLRAMHSHKFGRLVPQL